MIANPWFWFFICLLDVIITSRIMSRQGRHFSCLKNGEVRRFSMFNLKFPAHLHSTGRLIKNIRNLPDNGAETFRYLRRQLRTDFLFMPGAYIGTAIFCRIVAGIACDCTTTLLIVLAWLQLVAGLCHITKNIYLFKLIKTTGTSSAFEFGLCRALEFAKWGVSAGGFILAGFLLLYRVTAF